MNPIFLVAESDLGTRRLVTDTLTAKGYRVECVQTMAEARSLLKRLEPDMILAALDLDGGPGYDLLRMARDNGCEAPLVLLVDRDMDDPGGVVVRYGAMTYLRRPVDGRRLSMLACLGLDLKAGKVRERDLTASLVRTSGFLGSLLEAVDGAVFLLDPKGTVEAASERGAAMLGRPAVEVTGAPYLSLLPAGAAHRHSEALARAGTVLLPQRLEDCRGGLVLDILFRPVFQGHASSGFVVLWRDMTPQRRLEAELAESRLLYGAVRDSVRDAVLVFDRADGVILDGNEAAERFYGHARQALIGMDIADLMVEPGPVMEAIRSGVSRLSGTSHRRKDGTEFPAEMALSHFSHGGREVCTVCVSDISRRRAVEEALREGARLYRAVVEDQTELICRYTPDGALSFVNEAYAKFFGVDGDEVVGHEFFPALADDERRDVRSWLREAGPERPVFDREQRVVRHDGDGRWVLWTNRAVLDHRGQVVEIQAVGRDITERKEAEHALSLAMAEKEQYRLNLEATFRSIPDAIITVDSELRVIATNSAAATLLGIDREHARGTLFSELLPVPGNACQSVLSQVLRTSRSVHGYEAEFAVPGLGVRTAELNCTPLIDHDKRHAGAVLVVRDISRIADLEKRLHERQGFRGIIGRSSAMQDMYRLLEQLSSLDSTVIILGESGTGKELAAEALHYGGSRAGHPLVKVNCSALTESLLESELFGHVRGAFTGAIRDKAGRIQTAEGGTLFLDEIGDISPLIQLKLLRFLEQKEYERVGESRTCTADVRIIAATNADLRNAVRQGLFREDLYYRLNVMPVALPPLRARQADIPLLVDHFLEIFSNQFGKVFDGVSGEVMDLFMSYAWPGNIRELRHALEHACILAPGGEIALRHIRRDFVDQMFGGPPAGFPTTPGGGAGTVDADLPGEGSWPLVRPGRADRRAVLDALERCGGNKARAARQLGIHRATLYRRLKAWGLAD
ncbi:PAS domain S-box protein [Pseudodesulfovibrio sp. F-1]|uniref:PAS domain S-box protein n=1 Tax=Pseudodesulfovibrio alkaliphilus TaxID=2661613 RepID=A0A7K1KJZ7_9BACT|nr:PAS domain S-box protein [Pseudodesulfovibrio alkaliphilus]